MPLAPGLVLVSRDARGVELYFPPLRAPGAALALGAFGAVCGGISTLAVLGLMPAGGFDSHALLEIALVAAFIAPVLAFGIVFIVLAVYLLANSLSVRVGTARITSVRRVFGLSVGRREMQCADVTALEPEIMARYRSLFSTEPCYRLVAFGRAQPRSRLVLAEGLCSKAALEQVRHLIADAAGLGKHPGSDDERA
jgi:hypothetical protein